MSETTTLQDRSMSIDRVEPPARGPHHRPARTKGALRPTVDAPTEWRRPLAGITTALLLFETLTGLAIYLLPFSVFNQLGVLWHTVIGVVMVVPVGWYLGQHWWLRFRGKLSHFQLLGYVAAALLIALLVSGFVLTWQALFGTRISYTWDLVHLITGLVFPFALGAHLLVIWVRRVNASSVAIPLGLAKRRFLVWLAGGTGVLVALHAGSTGLYREVPLRRAFPADYSWKYGQDRPFAPSLARKDMSDVEERLKSRILAELNPEQAKHFLDNLRVDPSKHVGIVTVAEQLCDGMDLEQGRRERIDGALAEARRRFREEGMIDTRQLAGSAGCGTSGCHSEILAEWEPSAHRYSSMDFVFQAVQADFAEEKAPETTRYCAGCHDPIALFSGAKNVGNVTLSAEGADEGTSCLTCHSTVQTDVRGNADYTIQPARRYVYELHESKAAKLVSDFLIRAYPKHHVASYSRPLYKTAESCGACHKQFIDEELNEVGWVQGQNQYDSWRKSRWHQEGEPTKTVGCRECHMPLVSSQDPAAGDVHDPNRRGDDGKHRSHRFLAANQFVPHYHGLPGAEEHCALTVKWLRGEYDIPEIADRWTSGPVIRVKLGVPETARPGEQVRIQTILTNNKTGHDFPTGPLDMIEAWVEVTVTDESGNIVYASARPDDRDYLTNPQIVFKAELIDRLGQLIGEHQLWRTVGARFKRALFPGFTDTTEFVFECPAMPSDPSRHVALKPEAEQTFAVPPDTAGSELRVTATVWYCKFSAPFLDRLFGPEARVRSEVTDIARAEAVICVEEDGRQVRGHERASADG